ncbi:MAG: response regulator [Nitrospira sp.]|nr:response regulator [Nitrospira sp.]
MEPANILIVEDEPVVAKDIQLSLQRLGYRVPATATSGEEAIRKAGDTHPDLILMDIVLKGKMDGVETARQIQRRQDVPVIYLTAYADHHTLERAKVTSPAGYMLKPYQANELRTTIELALHRAQHDRHLREQLRWIATTIRCIGDGIVTTDQGGRMTYMNPAAEAWTGWTQEDAMGMSVMALMGFSDDQPLRDVSNPVKQAMAGVCLISIDDATLTSRQGSRRAICGTVAPVVDDVGTVLGAVLVFHEMSTRGQELSRPNGQDDASWKMESALSRPHGVINLCSWCKRVPDQSGEWYDLATFIAERSAIQFNGGLCPDCMNQCFPCDGGYR